MQNDESTHTANSKLASYEIQVEVCYALPKQQTLLKVLLPIGATVQQAIAASGMLQLYPDINLSAQKVGIFGQIKSLNAILTAHDRVEIYRPLKIDPKVSRQQRVTQARAAGSIEGRKWRK